MTGSRQQHLAGMSAFVAIPALVLATVFLALFFGGAGVAYGSLNDFFVAVTAALLVLPARALARSVGERGHRWFGWLTWLAIAGLTLVAIGQLLLIARLISLDMSFVTGGAGILPVLGWVLGQGYLGLRYGTPSRIVGGLAVAVLATSALLTVASSAGWQAPTWALSATLIAALAAYLAALGIHLNRGTGLRTGLAELS